MTLWTPWLVLSAVLSSAAAYLLGSVNFALVISKLFYHQDIRSYGSGNAGMTNILRTFGVFPAAMTLVGDFAKGAVSVLLAYWLNGWIGGAPHFMVGAYLAGLFALLGHVFPIYYGFRGGKGVLVSAGIILVVDPVCLCIVLGVFLAAVLLTRYMSLGSICAAAAYPIATVAVQIVRKQPFQQIVTAGAFALVVCAMVVYLHRSNIKRLLAHTEPKVGQKSKK